MIVDKNQTTRIYHPEEEGVWVDVVKLTGTELDLAEANSTTETLDKYAKHMATLQALPDRTDSPDRDLLRRKAKYDADTLIQLAVKSWSLEMAVSPENLALLDGVSRDWLHTEIVLMNTRPLVKSEKLEQS